jgi:FkbM family methyltransferase
MIELHKLRRDLRRFYLNLPGEVDYLQRMYSNYKRFRDRNRVVTRTVDGVRYELHLNQFIDSQIFYYGCFEEDTTKAIADIVRPGMTVLDIGANIGAHTFNLSKLVGDDGAVIAFEPMRWAQERLHKNLGLNSFSNITIEKLALSDVNKSGAASFRTSWNQYDDEGDVVEPEDNIRFQKLDDYLVEKDTKNVDFIKLDVDGFEFKILKGAVGTLGKLRPTLLMELGCWTLEKQGDSLLRLVEFLKSLGYEFFRESDSKHLPDYESILQEFPDPLTWTINAIVIHRSRVVR